MSGTAIAALRSCEITSVTLFPARPRLALRENKAWGEGTVQPAETVSRTLTDPFGCRNCFGDDHILESSGGRPALRASLVAIVRTGSRFDLLAPGLWQTRSVAARLRILRPEAGPGPQGAAAVRVVQASWGHSACPTFADAVPCAGAIAGAAPRPAPSPPNAGPD